MESNNQTISSSKPLPNWTTFHLKQFEKGLRGCKSVLMGDYLVILAHDCSYNPRGPEGEPESDDDDFEPGKFQAAVLFAIDLRDNSVDQVFIEGFSSHHDYSFTKYKENQIIKYGGMNSSWYESRNLENITIISFKRFHCISSICLIDFKALKIATGELNDDEGNAPASSRHSAQIYEDALYTFGRHGLWKFDLTKFTWEKLETTGEPPEMLTQTSSFLIEENMYVYGGLSGGREFPTINDIFVLNLKTLIWTRIQQQTGVGEQIDLDRGDIYGDLYKGNLLITGSDEICCWNKENNTWSTYKIQKSFMANQVGNLVVYKDLLLATAPNENGLKLGIFDLNNIDLPIPESPEQKHIKSLFLSEQDSDLKFKVQDKFIFAHKLVLIDKSQYFAGLFNSGMVESRQEVIEIQDCEYSTFQEFLRFLYYGKIDLNPDLAFKLLFFTDKYVQNDLHERCMDCLIHNINSENIYVILDFAFQHDLPILVTWCFHFSRNHLNIDNVSELIQYLDSNQARSEHAKEIEELRKRAIATIIIEYETIISKEQREKLPFYMEFLIRNVDEGTIRRLIEFIWDGPNAKSFSKNNVAPEASFEKDTAKLRKHIFSFVDGNFTKFKMNNLLDDLPSPFWLDFTSFIRENQNKSEVQIDDKEKEEVAEERKVNEEIKGRKRMEPVETEEAKPELKKNKK